MKNIFKFIFIFLFIILCFVGLSFYSPSVIVHDSRVSSQSWELSVSWVVEQVQSRVQYILDDREVQKTLTRIQKDAPLYNKDGAVFMNRERLLPVQDDKNYYSEWTVKTPGESDRGARRIIEGRSWELYFTDDHYTSFTRIR